MKVSEYNSLSNWLGNTDKLLLQEGSTGAQIFLGNLNFCFSNMTIVTVVLQMWN